MMKPANDPFAPTGEAGFAGPVACITLITRDLDATKAFYADVLEMATRHVDAPPEDVATQRELWALPPDFAWTETVFYRPTLPSVPQLRVLSSAQAAAPVRPDLASRLEGGLSVGFAMRDLHAVVARGAELGFHTTAGVGGLDMVRGDGSPYQALECHFRAPDDVYALGVSRPPDLAPVGPIEDTRTVGGPAYTGQVMNHRDSTLKFYTDVLGYEVRRTMQVSGGMAEQGLGLPAGTTLDFLQVFAPGSASGYFIVLDFGDDGVSNEAVAPPHAGVVLWTIPVDRVDDVAERVADVDCEVVAGPVDTHNGCFGAHRALTVRTANGFLVECIER